MESQTAQHSHLTENEEASFRAAVALLGCEIADLTERAEALDLDSVVELLNRAAKFCFPKVPDPQAT